MCRYRVSAYIAFIQTKSLDMEIVMDPIVVLGGLFAITERVNDYSTGPRFKLYVDFGKITEAWYPLAICPTIRLHSPTLSPSHRTAPQVQAAGLAAQAERRGGRQRLRLLCWRGG